MKPLLGLREHILALACVPCDSWFSNPTHSHTPSLMGSNCGWHHQPGSLARELHMLGHGMACSRAAAALPLGLSQRLGPQSFSSFLQTPIQMELSEVTQEDRWEERQGETEADEAEKHVLVCPLSDLVSNPTAAFQEVFVRALNTALGAHSTAVQVPRGPRLLSWCADCE